MKKEYICIAYGQKKETKEPYSRFAAVKTGQGYAYLDLKDTFYSDELVKLFQMKTLSDETK